MTALVPGTAAEPGRTPDERVYVLAPVRASHDGVVALVDRLAESLVERRAAPETSPGSVPAAGERRRPPRAMAKRREPASRPGRDAVAAALA